MPSSAENYHEATKYDPTTIGNHPGMDWQNKPSLTKEYQGAAHFGADDLDLSDPEPLDIPLDRAKRALLMRLLYCVYGVTALMESSDGERHSLRSAPSAGGLYPCEVYVMIGEGWEVPAGVYNFHVEKNTLQQIRLFSDAETIDAGFTKLSKALPRGNESFAPTFAIFVTSIFYRSSWRYQERGYRRCLLDSGHLIGNVLCATEVEGIDVLPMSGFLDGAINDLIGVDGEKEGTLAVILGRISEDERPIDEGIPRALRSAAYAPTKAPEADKVSDMMIRETMIQEADFAMAATTNPRQTNQYGFDPNLGFGKAYTMEAETVFEEEVLRGMLSRRSGRNYNAEPITFTQLMHTLNYGYARAASAFAPDLVHSYLAIHHVQGLPQGLHAFNASERTLYLLEEGDFRGKLAHLALGQQIAVLSSAVVIHTVDLTAAVQRWGNRAYRTVHLDAGLIGQRLAIAAQLQGFTTCGIGGFFDDDVNRLLTINDKHICAYLTTIGREDER